MKYLKILGLTAVAAMALTAFLGASSASATVLCTTTITENCASTEWDYGAGAVIDTSQVGTGSLETLSGTVLDTCSGATVKLTQENTGSSTETVSANIPPEDLTWEGCTKTTDTIKGATVEIHWIAGTDNGTVTIKEGEVTVNTVFGTCTYGFGKEPVHFGTLEGSHETPKLVVNTIVPRISGPCPAESRWTATFHVTSVNGVGKAPLFVSTS